MNMLNNVKVTTKLMLLLLVMVMGFGVIGWLYWQDAQGEAVMQARAATIRHYLHEIEEFEHEVAEAINIKSTFILSKQRADLEHFETVMSDLRKTAQKFGEEAPSEEVQGAVVPVSQALENFHAAVYRLAESETALGLDAKSGLKGEMHSAAQTLEDGIKKHLVRAEQNGGAREDKLGEQLALQKLLGSFQQMRLHTQDFLQSLDGQKAARVEEEIASFRTLMKQAKLADLEKPLATYQHHFAEAVKVVEAIKQGRAAVNKTAEAIDPAAEQLSDTTVTAEQDVLVALQSQRRQRTGLFIGVLFGTTVLLAGLVFLLGQGITAPLRRLQFVVQRIAHGDFAARANLKRGDEIGILADALDVLLEDRVTRLAEAERENETLNTSVIELLQAVARLGERDLTVRVPVAEDVTGPVADALNLLTEETATVLGEVTRISQGVAAIASRVKAQSDTVVTLATTERDQVTQTSNVLAEAADTMNHIATLAQVCNATAENAIQRTQAALETVTNTVRGINATRDVIRETEKRIKRLGERSQEISGAVSLINSIAERTHILALNASMHAASAGEAGRGFAVVADEVQRLAENARQATEQIASLVRNIQVETTDTVTTMNDVITQVVEDSRLAEQAGERMRETQQTTSELVTSVRQIAEGAQVQAKVSNELRDRARLVVESTLKTNEQLQEQDVQTSKLQEYSHQLVQAVSVFRLPGQAIQVEEREESMTLSTPTSEDEEEVELATVHA